MKSTFIYINFILLGLVGITSCQDDDRFQGAGPVRDPQTQADLDNQKLRTFLSNYTFNDKHFRENNNLTHQDIEFIRLINDSGDVIPFDSSKSSGISLIEDTDFLDSITGIEVNNIAHTAYFLKIREGEGKPVTIVDPVQTSHDVIDLANENESFVANEIVIGDTRVEQVIPLWSNPFNGQFGFTDVEGFREIASRFKTAVPILQRIESEPMPDENQRLILQCQVFTDNPNNNPFDPFSNATGFGVGVAFIPSGLAIFQESRGNNDGEFRTFQNLIYSFTLFNTEYSDLDNDGIPSLLEMIAPDGSIDSTIDTDNDGIPNYNDSDDDGDETATLEEVKVVDSFTNIDSNCDGILNNDDNVQFSDTNENGVPDHLDNTIRVGF